LNWLKEDYWIKILECFLCSFSNILLVFSLF